MQFRQRLQHRVGKVLCEMLAGIYLVSTFYFSYFLAVATPDVDHALHKLNLVPLCAVRFGADDAWIFRALLRDGGVYRAATVKSRTDCNLISRLFRFVDRFNLHVIHELLPGSAAKMRKSDVLHIFSPAAANPGW